MTEEKAVLSSKEISAKAVEAVDKADDAFLAGIFPAPPAEPKAAETAAAADAAAETNGSDGRSAADTKGVSSEGEEDVQSDPDLDKAYSTLLLDGYSDAMLAKFNRADAIALASKAKERQAKTAKELQSRAERIKQLEALSATNPAENPKVPTAVTDVDDLSKLKEAYGDEIVAPLSRSRQELQAAQQRIQMLEGIMENQLFSGARAGLREQFAQLDDPEQFATVKSDTVALLRSGRYDDAPVEDRVSNAMRDAARLRYFDEVKASEAGKALASYRKRLSSQPTPPTGKTPTPKAMTPQEREDALLEAIFKGDAEAKERLMRAG